MGLNDFDFEVKIRSPLYPTEHKETLISCLSNIFPKTNWEIEGEEIVGKTKYLTRFKSILEDMQIRDTARNYMKNRVLGEECSFTLSKQATCNAKINFSEQEQPLGGVEVKIICKDMMMLIENLTEIEE